jgi:hypothetical protein
LCDSFLLRSTFCIWEKACNICLIEFT